MRENLKNIFDIERLTTRIVMDKAHPKDLRALCSSLVAYNTLKNALGEADYSEAPKTADIIQLIEDALTQDPPVLLSEGNVIRSGYSKTLDRYRKIQTDFTQILNDYALSEKEKTGIASLKIRYTHSIGYYIEISKGKLSSVPRHFILRRTMVAGDRYTTKRLQELQDELLSSAQNIIEEEKQIFLKLRLTLKSFSGILYKISEDAAFIDCTSSFAWCAFLQNWVCPTFTADENIFFVRDGRHPVVEKHLASLSFVPNSAELGIDSDGQKTLALITGPNMAGKSTFLRQNALIALLAHTGSFVPAAAARMSITDRIFCRIGASDNLARGESTFLVEMTEAALILRQATEKSIVIMDEIGRGTSTTDGVAIAWAICEYLLNSIKCKTFFATHYHELAHIEHPRIKLLCLEVLENEGEIVFLKKIKEGESTSSFGVHVARLAGIPDAVIKRAGELGGISTAVSHNVSAMPVTESVPQPYHLTKAVQNPESLFSTEELIVNEMLGIKSDNITPLEALTLIIRWQKTLMGE
ncbi:MAG: hypothetical protein Ta2A_05000 [Treponemataceae bacterium]|nr:MAG: hypothetical protein Ta2A_05000 [Treponemataceae bacterium]